MHAQRFSSSLRFVLLLHGSSRCVSDKANPSPFLQRPLTPRPSNLVAKRRSTAWAMVGDVRALRFGEAVMKRVNEDDARGTAASQKDTKSIAMLPSGGASNNARRATERQCRRCRATVQALYKAVSAKAEAARVLSGRCLPRCMVGRARGDRHPLTGLRYRQS